ncbi:MAG: hypothetical protein HYZ28_08350 [Myxococcales bacterium]|nr:hypothetical protein [Myxococcales bacterium]
MRQALWLFSLALASGCVHKPKAAAAAPAASAANSSGAQPQPESTRPPGPSGKARPSASDVSNPSTR